MPRLEIAPLSKMAAKSHLSNVDVAPRNRAVYNSVCSCRADFYRQEFEKHHQCLERQREYYSEGAMAKAEDGLARILGKLEQICQREDACEVMGQLLRQLDVVTKLSAWTEPDKLH
jgi:hypothetical protein